MVHLISDRSACVDEEKPRPKNRPAQCPWCHKTCPLCANLAWCFAAIEE